MKRVFIAVLAILLAVSARAEGNRFFVSFQGGPSVTAGWGSTNYIKYESYGEMVDWVNGSIGIGYYHSDKLGLRLQAERNTNHGAYVIDPVLYRNAFKSTSAFLDFIFYGKTDRNTVYCRPYLGLGGELRHDVSEYDLGFRCGAILEYMFWQYAGIFLDLNTEWFASIDAIKGNGKVFPLSGRFNAQLGVAVHF